MKAFSLLTLISSLIFIVVGCSNHTEKPASESIKPENALSLVGTWKGEIKIPNQPLNIAVTFKQEQDAITGTITIPVQNVEDFALTDLSLQGDKISFKMALPGQSILFEGTIKEQNMQGTFTQNNSSVPFELNKKDETPQNPEDKENFLTIETEIGTLYGSLLVPEQGEHVPVALIIPGSGPTDRNGNSALLPGKNNSLKMLAEGLAEHGIASLRYDKRGAGKNAQAISKQEDMTFDQFVKDAGQWIDKLKEDGRFTNMIVIGHSQGSLEGMLAAKKTSVSAYISIAGAGRTIDQVLAEQLKTLPADLFKESEKILEQLRQGKIVKNVSEQLKSIFNPEAQPFLISWMKYNPAEELKQLKIPTMIMNGKHDIQVPVTEAKLLSEAKPDAKLVLIDEMNHVLKKAPADREANLKTYGDPSLPLADGLVKEIVEFLREHQTVEK